LPAPRVIAEARLQAIEHAGDAVDLVEELRAIQIDPPDPAQRRAPRGVGERRLEFRADLDLIPLERSVATGVVQKRPQPGGPVIGERPLLPRGRALEAGEIDRLFQACAGDRPASSATPDAASMAAKRAGVKLVVSSDSHSPRGFGLLQYGVNQARRGWLEPADVLNTQPLANLVQRQRLSLVEQRRMRPQHYQCTADRKT